MNGHRTSIAAQRTRAEEGERPVDSQPPLVLRCRSLKPENPDDEASVGDRQARVKGFSQTAMSNLTALLLGAGALGGEIAEGLVRKGIGTLKILDFDVVALSNLNRQFFFPEDLGDYKAWALARNLVKHGAMGTRIVAWNLQFENAMQAGLDLACDVVVSAVDDGETRGEISRFAIARRIPAVFGGASEEADFGRVFIHDLDGPCIACAFPGEETGERTPCPGSPAIKDLFKVLAGLMLYSIDSLVMDRPRSWNMYSVCPADARATQSGRITNRRGCSICGGGG